MFMSVHLYLYPDIEKNAYILLCHEHIRADRNAEYKIWCCKTRKVHVKVNLFPQSKWPLQWSSI
jgi:hypothetical protein